MNWSEQEVFDILQRDGCDWKFFKNFNPGGEEIAQYKIYDDPFKISYPDFEKYDNAKKVVLLVEVKGYTGFFNQQDKTLAMKHRQLKHYFVVQRKEQCETRIVFVIRKNSKKFYFWENLNNISNMEYYLDFFENEKGEMEKYIFWNCEDFRTDVENLSK